VLDGDSACFGLGDFLAFVGDSVAEDVFVNKHCFAVVLYGGVEGGEEDVHLEGRGVEGSPDAAEVVAHILAEVDGF